jgi:hypothetical protein
VPEDELRLALSERNAITRDRQAELGLAGAAERDEGRGRNAARKIEIRVATRISGSSRSAVAAFMRVT